MSRIGGDRTAILALLRSVSIAVSLTFAGAPFAFAQPPNSHLLSCTGYTGGVAQPYGCIGPNPTDTWGDISDWADPYGSYPLNNLETDGRPAAVIYDGAFRVYARDLPGNLVEYKTTNPTLSLQFWTSNNRTVGNTPVSSNPAVLSGTKALNLYAQGVNGHLLDFYKEPDPAPWKVFDLTIDSQACCVGGPATVLGKPAAYAPNAVDVYVRGSNNHLLDFYFFGAGPWKVFDITADAGATIAGEPVALLSFDQKAHVYARGTNDHMLEFWFYGNGPWKVNDLTAQLGVDIAGDPEVDGNSATGTVVLYARGTDGHMESFYKQPDPQPWKVFDLSLDVGGFTVIGKPAVYRDQAVHVYTRDCCQNLVEFYFYGAGPWKVFNHSHRTVQFIGQPAILAFNNAHPTFLVFGVGGGIPSSFTLVPGGFDTLGDAKQKLAQASLIPVVESGPTADTARVIYQNPGPGMRVLKYSNVDLKTAPAVVQMVQVPNVVHDVLSVAATAIQNAGLVLGSVTPPGYIEPQVTAQNPGARASVAKGSQVNLTVAPQASGFSQLTVYNCFTAQLHVWAFDTVQGGWNELKGSPVNGTSDTGTCPQSISPTGSMSLVNGHSYDLVAVNSQVCGANDPSNNSCIVWYVPTAIPALSGGPAMVQIAE